MISADMKINDGITPVLKGMQKALKQYPREALAEFVSLTPIKTGNARSNTYLTANKEQIVAGYAYAQPLDDGRSRQAPNGMTKPFEKWVAAKSKQIFGK
jgi:hypothetical protein